VECRRFTTHHLNITESWEVSIERRCPLALQQQQRPIPQENGNGYATATAALSVLDPWIYLEKINPHKLKRLPRLQHLGITPSMDNNSSRHSL
jgi:hypothetical protein